MSNSVNSVKLVMGYDGGATRPYTYDDIADSVCAGVKNNVKALNASLNGGIIDDFKAFFVDEGGHSAAKIAEAWIITTEEQELLGGE